MFIVADPGMNWVGDVGVGYRLIDKIKEAGASAVKFQMWEADFLYADTPIYNDAKKFETTPEKAYLLERYARDIGLEWFCTPTKQEHVDILEDIGVSRYKIRGRDCDNKELINRVVDTGCPFVISHDPTKELYIPVAAKEVVVLEVVLEYPTQLHDIDFNRIVTRLHSGEIHGFSDHTTGLAASLFSVAHGASIIERHVCLPERYLSPDLSCSITTDELALLVKLCSELEYAFSCIEEV